MAELGLGSSTAASVVSAASTTLSRSLEGSSLDNFPSCHQAAALSTASWESLYPFPSNFCQVKSRSLVCERSGNLGPGSSWYQGWVWVSRCQLKVWTTWEGYRAGFQREEGIWNTLRAGLLSVLPFREEALSLGTQSPVRM